MVCVRLFNFFVVLIVCNAAMAGLAQAQTSVSNPWFSPAFYQAKPVYLTDIELSVEQQDGLFKLLHAQLPAIRELQLARVNAERAVQAQALLHNYDREVLEPLIEDLAKAIVAEQIQRAEIDSRIISLLTPAQRDQVNRWWQANMAEAVFAQSSGDAAAEATPKDGAAAAKK